ncbi:MAG: bacteriocin immunity protein [Pseudomonas sp.]
MISLKESIEEYTEAEFLSFLEEFFDNKTMLQGTALSEYWDSLVEHFERITQHPAKSDVIYYPKEGQEDSPAGILKEVKEWRARNNKPGFKPE